MDVAGPFKLRSLLGQGGMAQVWRGQHSVTGTEVAIKVLRPDKGPEGRQSFQREARALALMNHPAVIRLLDQGVLETDGGAQPDMDTLSGRPFLVMELAIGGTLGDWLQATRTWGASRRTLQMLLDGLAHIHARGVVHRDLKPTNVLLCGDEQPRPGFKIADFGIATGAGEVKVPGGRVLGTPRYMAPEQIRNSANRVGPATDLYALGVIAWHMVTGRPLFGATSGPALLNAQLSSPPPALSPIQDIPVGLEAWLRELLQKDPRARFQSAAEAAAGLAELESGLRLSVAGDTPPPEPCFAATTQVRDCGPDDLTGSGAGTAIRAPLPLPIRWRRAYVTSPPRWLPGVGRGLFELRRAPIVGRERERDAIWGALRNVSRTGIPHCMWLEGAPGAGTSCLARWMCERVLELGVAQVLRAADPAGRASESGELPAVLANHYRFGSKGNRSLVDHIAGQLKHEGVGDLWEARELAALGGRPAGVSRTSSWWRSLSRSGERAMFRLVARLSAHGPVVLVLDEADKDREAMRLIAALQRTDLPVLVLATSTTRPQEHMVSVRTLDPARTERLELTPWSDASSRALVDALLGLSQGLRNQVVGLAGGMPGVLVRLVRALSSNEALTPHDEGWGLAEGHSVEIPPELREFWTACVHDLLGELSLAEVTALTVAALLGPEVDDCLWRQACGVAGVGGGVRGFDALLDRGWARELGPNRWSFAPDLLVDVLVERTAPERLVHLRRACARALRRDRGPGAERLRAEHLVAAGQGSEALDALLCSVVGWHRQGDTRQARASCIVWEQTAKDMALVAGDPRWGDFWRLRGVLARDGGQLERAEECFHIALRGAELHGWSTITCVLTSLGHLAALRHEPALAESFHRRALATADALGDPAWALHARSVVAILWAQQGRLQEASVLLREAVGLGDHTSQGHALSDALESLASATMMQGELALARSYAQKAKRDDQPAPQACPVQSCVLAQ